MKEGEKQIVFGGGCFWCTEAVFRKLKGVSSVLPGYAGGTKEKPTYEEVCSGKTGHAEVIQITYDPKVISFRDLLIVFFSSHDGSQLNRQGADVGTQYRSIILYTDEEQKNESGKFIEEVNASSSEGRPLVTVVEPLKVFYEAEDYHKDYFSKNPKAPYCQVIINPKLLRVQERFSEMMKNNH